VDSRRLSFSVAIVALLIGLGAVAYWLLTPTPTRGPDIDADTMPTGLDLGPGPQDLYKDAKVGGTYEGKVVDEKGEPIRDADVLLVAVDAGAKVMYETYDADGNGQPVDIPIFGEYKTAARGVTKADGSFSLPAGSARVVAIVASRREYSPGLRAHTEKSPLKPGEGHIVVLSRAGWLKGRVVDKATKEPVRDVDVAIYLQGRANQGRPGPDPLTPTNGFHVFQTYVARELGPLVWGISAPPGDTGFHMSTSSDGQFQFGPIMKEVQVEVILTHPEYMWTDSDPSVLLAEDFVEGKKPADRRRRTVVPPGETVERTYELEKGREVRGTVKDSEGKAIPDVEVSLTHVAQYAQHHRYRTTARTARTDAQGRFRIAGLSLPPYNLRMTHPSFDTEYWAGVKDGTDVPYQIQKAGGWIELTVDGGPTEHPQWSARAYIEATDKKTPRRDELLMVRDSQALIERVKPGKYDVFLVSGTKVSTSVQVDVLPESGAKGVVKMGAGGGMDLAVRDANGAPIDPVIADLEFVAEGQASGRRAATLVSREGRITSQGLLPGRYVAELRAPTFMSARSEPFVVTGGATATVPAVVLHKQAYVRIKDISGADGRPLAGTVEVALYISEGGKEFERRRTLANGDLPVAPGEVILKAESSDGRRSEQTIHPADGEIVSVEIRLSR
jgi:hypothetical protein